MITNEPPESNSLNPLTPEQEVEFSKILGGTIKESSAGVVQPLSQALNKTVDNSNKLIDQAHGLAKQGPVYAMVFLSAVLIAAAIIFSEWRTSAKSDFIASLVISSVLLIAAGILRLINNMSELREASRQVSELTNAVERTLKLNVEQVTQAVTQPQAQLQSPTTPGACTNPGSRNDGKGN